MSSHSPPWDYEIARLRNPDILKRIMDDNIARSPSHYKRPLKLLDGFFSDHPSPIDIALILYGALSHAQILAYHLEGNSLLFYRPKASHKRTIEKAFMEGFTHPERTLLIFDSDMVTGNAMRETADFFTQSGYDRSRIFGYLDQGCKWRKYKTELKHIDDLLRK